MLHDNTARSAYPITSKQLRYLIDNNYMDLPKTTKQEIWDKSKADKFAKAIVLIQTGWFLIEALARAIRRPPVTPMEIETLSVILVTIATFLLWYNKPKDVEEPIDVYLNTTTANVLIRAGNSASLPFQDTSLDFIEPRFHISSMWSEWLLRLILRWGFQTRPLNRMPNNNNPRHTTLLGHFTMIFILTVFVGLPFADWNFPFPTHAEVMAWRVSLIVVAGSLAFHILTEQYCAGLSKLYFRDGDDYKQRWTSCLIVIVPAGVNFVARLCLVAVCLSSLRKLPVRAFVTVQWTTFIPHI